jgi:hypothetical protein
MSGLAQPCPAPPHYCSYSFARMARGLLSGAVPRGAPRDTAGQLNFSARPLPGWPVLCSARRYGTRFRSAWPGVTGNRFLSLTPGWPVLRLARHHSAPPRSTWRGRAALACEFPHFPYARMARARFCRAPSSRAGRRGILRRFPLLLMPGWPVLGFTMPRGAVLPTAPLRRSLLRLTETRRAGNSFVSLMPGWPVLAFAVRHTARRRRAPPSSTCFVPGWPVLDVATRHSTAFGTAGLGLHFPVSLTPGWPVLGFAVRHLARSCATKQCTTMPGDTQQRHSSIKAKSFSGA